MTEELADLFTHLPLPNGARLALAVRMAEPGRHYHDAGHLALLWSRHRAYAPSAGLGDATTARLMACAIAYHDAVYDPKRRDNEARSAALWREAAGETRLPEAEIEWVAGTILATADHFGHRLEPDDVARLFMLDLDLTPLGEAPEVFDHNTALLRAEYAHLDDAQWAAGRRAFLARLQAMPHLYRTPVIAEAFEAQARRNIAAAIAP